MNTLPNRITATQAHDTAGAVYAQYTALKTVYDHIRAQAAGGAISLAETVNASYVAFINSELTNDGFTTTISGNTITINWGPLPDGTGG